MKCINLFVILLTTLIINSCFALTCEEINNIFNIKLQNNCCDLQYVTCDSSNENILSIDILSLKDDIINNQENNKTEVEVENTSKLFARKLKKHRHHHHGNDDDDDECVDENGNTLNSDECDSASSIQITSIACILLSIMITMILL